MKTCTCLQCGREFQNVKIRKTCSTECKVAWGRVHNPAYQKHAIPGEKLCKKCGEVKPYTLEHFPPSAQRHVGGLYPYCRPCNRAKRDKWATDYPERERLSERVDRFKTDAKDRNSPLIQFTTADYLDLFYEQGGVCGYCFTPIDRWACHLDHVMPVSRGGETIVANLLMTCASCNHRKGASTLDEWKERGGGPVWFE